MHLVAIVITGIVPILSLLERRAHAYCSIGIPLFLGLGAGTVVLSSDVCVKLTLWVLPLG